MKSLSYQVDYITKKKKKKPDELHYLYLAVDRLGLSLYKLHWC